MRVVLKQMNHTYTKAAIILLCVYVCSEVKMYINGSTSYMRQANVGVYVCVGSVHVGQLWCTLIN